MDVAQGARRVRFLSSRAGRRRSAHHGGAGDDPRCLARVGAGWRSGEDLVMTVTMSEWEGTAWSGSEPETRALSVPDEDLSTFVSRLSPSRIRRPWRVPSVRQALGVPAIQRAVSLISSTTGMLSMQGFQRGAVMADPPRLIVRP